LYLGCIQRVHQKDDLLVFFDWKEETRWNNQLFLISRRRQRHSIIHWYRQMQARRRRLLRLGVEEEDVD